MFRESWHFFLTTLGSHLFPGSVKKDEVWTITYSLSSISQCFFNQQCHLSNQLPCRLFRPSWCVQIIQQIFPPWHIFGSLEGELITDYSWPVLQIIQQICVCYFACDQAFLCLHRQRKDGQRGTDGALCRMIPQQTLSDWLFNVKCNKCLGGCAIEAEKCKSLFLLLVLCILIKKGALRSHTFT